MSEHLYPQEPSKPEAKRVRLHHGEAAIVDMTQGHPDEFLNGDVIAVLEFPPQLDHVSKRVAVVDYGEDFAGKDIIPGFVDGQGRVRKFGGLGHPETRYGLRAENYEADDHIRTYAALPQGTELLLGRDSDKFPASQMLGLNELTSGNGAVSRQHVSLSHNGHSLRVTDLSEHGTVVETYPRA
jgi:hypothetical protein